MVSQVLEYGSLRVNKSKLEILVGPAGPRARRINAEIARGAYQLTFRGEAIRVTAVVKYLGCQLEAQGNTHAEAQMSQVSKPSSVSSRVVGPSLHRLEHQNQAVADTGSEHFAVRSRSSCMATARCGNFGEMANPRTAVHCKSPCSCVSRTHARPPKETCSAHGHVHAASSEVTLG